MVTKIAVCIPHTGSVTTEWSHKMYFPLASKYKMVLCAGMLNLDSERNRLVKEALKDPEVTHILFVDSDVIVEGNVFDAIDCLVENDFPIISGIYRLKQDQIPFNFYRGNLPVKSFSFDNPTENLIIVDAVGFGFVLIKREVFEKVPAPWFVWKEDGDGEDIFACKQFLKYGYRIVVHTGVRLSHIGTFKINSFGNYESLSI